MLLRLRDWWGTKVIALSIASWLILSSFVPVLREKVILRAGTPVMLETTTLISSNAVAPGQEISLRVKYDVKVGDKVVIRAGAPATAQVIRVQKAKALGKPGYIEIEAKSVTAVDGTRVPLTGGRVYVEGDDRQTLSIVLGIFVCVLLLLLKGKEAEIPPGYTIQAQVASDTPIEVN